MNPLEATDDMAMWPCPCMSGGKTEYLKGDRTGKRREKEGEEEEEGERERLRHKKKPKHEHSPKHA